MMMRIWSSAVMPGQEARFLEYATNYSREMFLKQPGCLGVLLLRSADRVHAACTFWRDRSSAEALASSKTYKETVAGLHALGVLEGEATIQLFEVASGTLPAIDP
jgi:heme-degrading monooxygenase HmoA